MIDKKYTVFTRDLVLERYSLAHAEPGQPDKLVENYGPAPAYPKTFIRLVTRAVGFDIHDEDSASRLELWEDSAGTLTADDDQVKPLLSIIYAGQIQQLWQAATDWQEKYISGLAGGILTIGVMMQKPKALAVMQWSGALWDIYYMRKTGILAGENVSFDFSIAGDMPFSVPELRSELGM